MGLWGSSVSARQRQRGGGRTFYFGKDVQGERRRAMVWGEGGFGLDTSFATPVLSRGKAAVRTLRLSTIPMYRLNKCGIGRSLVIVPVHSAE